MSRLEGWPMTLAVVRAHEAEDAVRAYVTEAARRRARDYAFQTLVDAVRLADERSVLRGIPDPWGRPGRISLLTVARVR